MLVNQMPDPFLSSTSNTHEVTLSVWNLHTLKLEREIDLPHDESTGLSVAYVHLLPSCFRFNRSPSEGGNDSLCNSSDAWREVMGDSLSVVANYTERETKDFVVSSVILRAQLGKS